MNGSVRHFLDLIDIPAIELRGMIDASRAMKLHAQRARGGDRPLAGKTLAMVFDKPSTRTRVSFDIAMRQLGGDTIVLTGQEMQIGRGGPSRAARVLALRRAVMIRIRPRGAHRAARQPPPSRSQRLTRFRIPQVTQI